MPELKNILKDEKYKELKSGFKTNQDWWKWLQIYKKEELQKLIKRRFELIKTEKEYCKTLAEHELFKNLIIGNFQSLGQLVGIFNNTGSKETALVDIYNALKDSQ